MVFPSKDHHRSGKYARGKLPNIKAEKLSVTATQFPGLSGIPQKVKPQTNKGITFTEATPSP